MLITSCAELWRNFKWLVRVTIRVRVGVRDIFRVTVRVRVGVRDHCWDRVWFYV